jgi:hypothetical protein
MTKNSRSTTRVKRISYVGMGADQILSLYPTEFTDCRIQHDWPGRFDRGFVRWTTIGPGLRDRRSRCKRCGYEKVEHFDASWNKVKPDTPSYPRGYLTTGTGLRRPDFRAHSYSTDFAIALDRGEVEDLQEHPEGTTDEVDEE